MRKILALLCLLATPLVQADTYTTHYNLTKPNDGSTTWGTSLRDNFDSIDTQLYLDATTASNHIAQATGAHKATAISTVAGAVFCLSSINVQTYLDCLDANAVFLNKVQTLTNKTINGASNTITNVSLSSGVTGNLPVTNLDGGLNADSSHFWAGDGHWRLPVQALTSAHIYVGSASNVAADVAMSGDVAITNTGVTSIAPSVVTGKAITGFVSGAGTVSSTDSILSAINKLDGNIGSLGGNAITALTADVTATGPGSVAATVAAVGGSTAANVHTAEALVNGAQSGNKFLGSPANGTSAAPSYRALVGADLPNPSSSTLGGIESAAAVSHQWINSLSTSGVPALSQPAFTDISGSVASTQMPALTSDVTTSAGAVATTVAKIQGTTVSGTTGSGNVVFSASPTFTGTIGAGALTLTTPLAVAQGGSGLISTSQNFGFMGPTSGAGAPTWRALVAGDIPDVSATYLTKANNLSDVANSATSWNNISGFTLLGDMPYGGASGVRSVLAGNTTSTKKFLRQTGTGTVSAAPAWDTLVGSDLPNPSSSTLGGVQSAAAVSHQWINSISTSGVPALSQPAFTDVSGSVAASQLPNPSSTTLGGIESYAAVTNQWINAISTSGVPSSAQPAFTDISGSVAAGQMPALTGDVTTSAGAVATTIAANAVSNSKLATMAANTVKANVTGSSAVPTDVSLVSAATASTGMIRDSSANVAVNNLLESYQTIATAAATTTLTVASPFQTYFTGSTTQTVALPVASTLVLGQQFQVVNSSSGVVTVQSSGANTVQAMAANSYATFTCILTSGTTAASWSVTYATASAGGGSVTSVAMTVPSDFTVSGSPVTTSGTLAVTANTQTANLFKVGPTSGSAAAPTYRALASSDRAAAAVSSPADIVNLALTYSIASSALTANIVQADGTTTASADNPAVYYTRSTTATTGSYTKQAITGATSVVLSSKTTLGFTSSVNNWLYFYGATSGVMLASSALWDDNSLASYIQEAAAVTTISNASPAVVTLNGHGLNNGDAITFTTSGALPTGLAIATTYYVVSSAANTFSVSATPNGTAINTSGAGSGTHTYHIAGTRLVCTSGTANAANQGIKYLGRMQFNITAGTWAAPGEVSPGSSNPAPITFFLSSAVTTQSTNVTAQTYTTFSNSPALAFTPTLGGTYRVWSQPTVIVSNTNVPSTYRVNNTTGSATLLAENDAYFDDASGGRTFYMTFPVESVYTLTAGTLYIFDIQGENGASGGTLALTGATIGSTAGFRMFAQRVGD